MSDSLVFLDVDTQTDFMLPSGALYVPKAEAIIPNLKKLFDFARAQGIPVISSADAHRPDDPSFSKWPPHCVIGTAGQRRIPETLFSSAVVIPNRPGAFTNSPPKWAGQWIVEKADYDVSSNPNFDAILASLGRRRFVVFGVATDYCVRGIALALRKRDLPVDLVTDAIRGIKPEDERKAIEEMVHAGVREVTTDQVCLAVPRDAASASPP